MSIVIKTPYQLKLEGTWSILLLIVLLIVIGIFFWRQDQADRRIWLPFLPIVISCTILGFLTRMNRFAHFFETTTGKYTIAGLMLVSLLFYYPLFYLSTKKSNASSK